MTAPGLARRKVELKLHEIGNEKRINDDNPVAFCGKIREEGDAARVVETAG